MTDRTRILFLAFGYSIHARRRIGVFARDPRFEVHVCSNHAYEIPGAGVTVLDGKHRLAKGARRYAAALARGVQDFINRHGLVDADENLVRELFSQGADYRRLLQVYRSFKPDLIFLQTLLYPCYLGCFLPPETPLAITFWNGDLVWWAQQNEVLKRYKKLIVTKGIRRARAVTVNSDLARRAALEYGIAPERLQVIRYPGVDLELFHPGDKAEARRRLGLGDGPVILCPRGLGAYLNSESVMDAAGAVCRLNRDAVFLFVSEVGEKLWPELKVRAIAAGAGERNLRHDGHVDWTAMPDYHRAADLMVSVSSNDSQPNCMLEAMACGTPVIMGDIEAIREWVTHEENGLLVAPGDAGELAASILRMLRDGRLAERFVPANLAKVRERVDSRVTCEQVKDMALQVSRSHGSIH